MQSDGEFTEPLLGSMALRRMKQRVGRALIPRLPITRHLFNHLRWELRAFWVRVCHVINPWYIVRRIRFCQGSDISANVGCAGTGRAGSTWM